MKALCGKGTERAQVSSLILGKQPMGIVLYNRYPVFGSYLANGVHLARYAGIVDEHNCLSARRNQAFQLRFVHVQRVRANIDEYRFCAAQHISVDRTHESK